VPATSTLANSTDHQKGMHGPELRGGLARQRDMRLLNHEGECLSCQLHTLVMHAPQAPSTLSRRWRQQSSMAPTGCTEHWDVIQMAWRKARETLQRRMRRKSTGKRRRLRIRRASGATRRRGLRMGRHQTMGRARAHSFRRRRMGPSSLRAASATCTCLVRC
jgi:hypothetical protein